MMGDIESSSLTIPFAVTAVKFERERYQQNSNNFIMALSQAIRQSKVTFELTGKIVRELSSKLNMSSEDLWKLLSDMTEEQMAKKLKRERKKERKSSSSVTKARTAYTFFTKENRKRIMNENPTADFKAISGFVALEWRSLTPALKQHYTELADKDKLRFTSESKSTLAPVTVVESPASADEQVAEQDASPVKRRPRNKAVAPVAADVAAPPSAIAGGAKSPPNIGGHGGAKSPPPVVAAQTTDAPAKQSKAAASKKSLQSTGDAKSDVAPTPAPSATAPKRGRTAVKQHTPAAIMVSA
jgi:hypothetical protein